jgi:hypothetical protein
MNSPIRHDHHRLDARSRALHAAIASRIRRDPALLAIPLANLDRWEQEGGPARAFQEWRQILLSEPLELVLSLLEEDSERADRLRQSSPFTGILSPEERAEIFRSYAPPRA